MSRPPGSAVAVVQAGRRALAVEVQALVGSADGAGRRQVTGLDPRRFQLVAAVLDRATGLPLGRADLFGASSGGIRVDDPASDLAVAAALASAATGSMPPAGAAFVGEVSLNGALRPAPGMPQRLAAARGAGSTSVFAPGPAEGAPAGLIVHSVGHVHPGARLGDLRNGGDAPGPCLVGHPDRRKDRICASDLRVRVAVEGLRVLSY